MKIKKKLRDLTKEEYQDYKKDGCNSNTECSKCIFGSVNCTSEDEGCWVLNKDMYSDKFLDQEVEIEVPDILTKKDKKYLEVVLKPLYKVGIKDLVKGASNMREFEYLHCSTRSRPCDTVYFKTGTMFKNMELDKHYTFEELGLFKKKNKIDLTYFWNSKEKLAIHCGTTEKTNKLLKAFHKLGKTWADGDLYVPQKRTLWSNCEEEICYDNKGFYGDYDDCKRDGYTIYEFDDVDLKK